MKSKINLINFDIYAKRASFFYNKQEKIGSYFSVFLTLLYIIISIILFIYNLIITIKRTEIKVYDSSLYAQEMPIININKEYFNFAFGLEDPTTLNKFVDERIYIPEVYYVDRLKINGEFVTITNQELELEKCKQEEFGDNHQHLLLEGELSNSYCLKDFNYNLTFAGGFKYERMSYIRIKIFPCKNTTKNNNHCKPQEELDAYMTSGYFSILLKDIGLNPSNFTYPTIPTLQDLYTTVDRRLYKNYILNFGLTEIQTDIGLFNEQIKNDKYIQFRKEFQTSSFRDEGEYLKGKDICLIQIRLDDNILIQKRNYTKISEILSRIGGYMQLMYTVFLLLAASINKIDSELKIINSIFNFNLNQNKIVLKLKSLKTINSMTVSKSDKRLILPLNNKIKSVNTFNFDNNRSNNNLIIKNNFNNIIMNGCNTKKMNKKKKSIFNKIYLKSSEENKNKSINSIINLNKNGDNNVVKINNEITPKNNNFFNVNRDGLINDNNAQINLNMLNYFCHSSNPNKKRLFELYNHGNEFYRKRMDIVLVFSHLLLTEKALLSNNYQNLNSAKKDIEILFNQI